MSQDPDIDDLIIDCVSGYAKSVARKKRNLQLLAGHLQSTDVDDNRQGLILLEWLIACETPTYILYRSDIIEGLNNCALNDDPATRQIARCLIDDMKANYAPKQRTLVDNVLKDAEPEIIPEKRTEPINFANWRAARLNKQLKL